ncbi:TlpA family protein disulfide reductase [Tumebacillus lipolyticus]|uniref:TlpA family protein disulfide reductase n=1 Tax=Tumebacillus lipolyticus TaxID=1280370 RepID=A0ABW5A1M2_9BACL
METFLVISNIVLWICMIALIACFFYLARMVGDFLNRFRIKDGKLDRTTLKVGQQSPFFRLIDQRGEMVRLPAPENRYTAILFKNSSCGTCLDITTKLAQLSDHYFSMRLVLIDEGEEPEAKAVLPEGISLSYSSDVFQSYFVDKVPMLFIIDPNGVIVHFDYIDNYLHMVSLLERSYQQAV